MNKCGECENFEREKWHAELGGGDQHNGKCKTLSIILSRLNYAILSEVNSNGDISVPECFGCNLWEGKS